MRLKNTMSEEEMQQYANEKLGYEVEYLFEYATEELGYESTVVENENSEEEYVFLRKIVK